jgi:hypothetical protein
MDIIKSIHDEIVQSGVGVLGMVLQRATPFISATSFLYMIGLSLFRHNTYEAKFKETLPEVGKYSSILLLSLRVRILDEIFPRWAPVAHALILGLNVSIVIKSYRTYVCGTNVKFQTIPKMEDRVYIVTGANAGLSVDSNTFQQIIITEPTVLLIAITLF